MNVPQQAKRKERWESGAPLKQAEAEWRSTESEPVRPAHWNEEKIILMS